MPRQARIDATGELHHIIVRGIERCKIFQPFMGSEVQGSEVAFVPML
jgi:hypothetical protein